MTTLLPPGHYARANWGRWLVDCPSPFCESAMRVGRGQGYTACWECGTTMGPLIWPPDPEGIELILSMRPMEKNRNWEPGESLEDLLVENITHGHDIPGLDLEGGQQQIMLTVDNRIVGGLLLDALPSVEQRKMIGA